MGTRKYKVDVDWMVDQYVNHKKSTGAIGAELGMDLRLVGYHLKRKSVQMRTTIEQLEANRDAVFESIKDQVKAERLAGARVKDLQAKYANMGCMTRIAALCAALPPRKPIHPPRVRSEAERKKLSLAAKAQWQAMTEEQRASLLSASKAAKQGEKNVNFGKVWGGKGRGTRIAGTDSSGSPVIFRSTWEAKFADFLTNAGHKWRYEPRTFRCGELGTYTPDFFVESWGCFVEIKGWLTDQARAKIEWFRNTQEHPIILATRDVLRNQYGLEIR